MDVGLSARSRRSDDSSAILARHSTGVLFNTTGNNNTATGVQALESNDGDNNTADGYQALLNNRGSENTAVGDEALVNNITGSFNTAIGNAADV